MRSSHRTLSFVVLCLLGSLLFPATSVADKLKGFYSGSGGMSQEGHRTLFIEFAADGTALLQQQWHEKDPQTWHARWVKNGKTVTLTYEPGKDVPAPAPLVFTFKHGSLTATSWDVPTLGALGPPTLRPFGGQNVQVGSVASCQSLNTGNPTGNCVTWSSKERR